MLELQPSIPGDPIPRDETTATWAPLPPKFECRLALASVPVTGRRIKRDTTTAFPDPSTRTVIALFSWFEGSNSPHASDVVGESCHASTASNQASRSASQKIAGVFGCSAFA